MDEARSKGSRFFRYTENEIRGRNGTVFRIIRLNGQGATIKSYEGYQICWIDEASSICQSSLDALIPTNRQQGSELCFTYNPGFIKRSIMGVSGRCVERSLQPPSKPGPTRGRKLRTARR